MKAEEGREFSTKSIERLFCSSWFALPGAGGPRRIWTGARVFGSALWVHQSVVSMLDPQKLRRPCQELIVCHHRESLNYLHEWSSKLRLDVEKQEKCWLVDFPTGQHQLGRRAHRRHRAAAAGRGARAGRNVGGSELQNLREMSGFIFWASGVDWAELT